MSTGDDSDAIRLPSSSDQAGTAHEAETTSTPTGAEPVSTGSTPSTSSVPETAPPAASGAPAPAKPGASTTPDADPVRDAVAFLARDNGQPRDDKGRFAPTAAEKAAAEIARKVGKPPAPPAKGSPPKSAPAAAPVTTKTPEAPAATAASPGVDTDPYHGFDERELGALKGKTRQRIEELHRRATEAREALTQAQAKASEPDEFARLVQEHQLDEDVGFVPPAHVAGLVKAQAAVTRAMIALEQQRAPAPGDLQVVNAFLGNVDKMRDRLGLKPAAAPAPQIVPFQGDLSPEHKELVEVYGFPEADVRLFAAIKAAKSGAGATTQQPSNAALPPSAQAAAPAPRGVGPDMDALYGQRFTAELTRAGVQPSHIKAHYQVILPIAATLTQERFPTVPLERIPAVFDALPPKERFEILSEAHRKHQANVAKPTPPVRPTPPPPATPPRLNGAPPRAAAPAANQDQVASAIAFLARPGSR